MIQRTKTTSIPLILSVMVIADYLNDRVRMVKNGIITTVAAGTLNLLEPSGVTVLPTGELLISDTGNHRIRKVASNGAVSTIAGTGTKTDSGGSNLGITVLQPWLH